MRLLIILKTAVVVRKRLDGTDMSLSKLGMMLMLVLAWRHDALHTFAKHGLTGGVSPDQVASLPPMISMILFITT